MELIVRADNDVIAELYPWLLEDMREVRQTGTTVTLRPGTDPGSMGAAEVIALILPDAIALGQLVVSIVAFRSARKQNSGSAPGISIGQLNTIIAVEGEAGEVAKRLLSELPEAPSADE